MHQIRFQQGLRRTPLEELTALAQESMTLNLAQRSFKVIHFISIVRQTIKVFEMTSVTARALVMDWDRKW